MREGVQDQVKEGFRISYDDGRPGHRGVRAMVLEVTVGHGMLVQFEDRAETSYIRFSDRQWMDFISIDN
jgi:hypothetical protein